MNSHTPISLPAPSERPVLLVEEVARLLGISRSSGYQAVKNGDLPSIRIGRRVVVPTAKLHEMLGTVLSATASRSAS